MTCVVPPFTSDNDIKSNISYTVRAPGPDLTDELLTLNVKPNPSFGDNAIAKTSLSEGELLTITVSACMLTCTNMHFNISCHRALT